LYCGANQLTSLDVRNGNNMNIISFYTDGNPSLTCINVDDSTWSTNNWIIPMSGYFHFDPQHYFSNNCPSPASWDCNNGVCSDPGTGNGAYASLGACQSNCAQTAIQEHTTNKELLKVTDLLGRETKGSKNEVLFYIYDDGTVEKKIILE
jgi:hypothetical protein